MNSQVSNLGDEQAVEALSALAHSSRLMIVRSVAKAEPAGIAAGALGLALGLPSATLSFHLKELTRSKVLRSRKEGRFVIFSLDKGSVERLVRLLLYDCFNADDEIVRGVVPSAAGVQG